MTSAKADIDSAIRSLPVAVHPFFVSVLDRLAAAEELSSSPGKGQRPAHLYELEQQMPSLSSSTAGLSQAVYLDSGRCLRFQSQLHRAVWPMVRHFCVEQSRPSQLR